MSGLGTPVRDGGWERYLDALEQLADDPLAHATAMPPRPAGTIPPGLVARAEAVLVLSRAAEDEMWQSLGHLRRQLRAASDGQRRLAHVGPRPATLDITV